MSYQYYAMDVGEILWLLVVLSLWVLSIICCIKRYGKISTIERADVITRDKTKTTATKNDVPQTECASLDLNNQINNVNNLIVASNTSNQIDLIKNTNTSNNNNNPSNSNTLDSNRIKNKDLNNGYIPYSNTNKTIYTEAKPGKQYSNIKNVIVIDETSNKNNNNNNSNYHAINAIKNQKYRYEIVSYTKLNHQHKHLHHHHHHHQLPHQHAKHNRIIINKTQYQHHNKLKCFKTISTNQPVLNDQARKNKHYLLTNSNKIINDKLIDKKSLIKSSSEPALHDLLLPNNILLSTQSTNTPLHNNNNNKHIRSTSINDIGSVSNNTNDLLLINSTSNYSDQFNPINNICDMSPPTKCISFIKTTHHPQDTNYLIDPNRIPKIIRKSLLDLHRRSVLNLSQHNSSINLVNNNNNNNININTNTLSMSNVYTQQRHKNEIKMNIKNNKS